MFENQYVEVVLDKAKIRVHYHRLGSPDSYFPPIVMLHGSGPAACGAHNFRSNVAHFVDLGFQLILIDWPGWGKSDPIVTTDSRSGLNARVLRAVLDAIGIEQRTHIMGNSMGAHSATMFALDNPDRVSKLILIGGGNGAPDSGAPLLTKGMQRIRAFYEQPNALRMGELLRTVVYNSSSVTDEVVQGRFEAAMQRPDHIDSYVRSVQATPVQYPDMSSRLPEISAPTLIFWGQNDHIVPLELGLKVASLIPNSEMHIFNRCGHVPHMEAASKFNQLASWFLLD